MLGILTGTAVVAVITFAEIPIGSWDSGLIALGPNLLVTAAAEWIRRSLARPAASRRSAGTPDHTPVAVAGGAPDA
jgi:SSS family solute:Na+ symporter